MQTMQLHARVGSDGVLRLSVPFEPHEAGADVQVTIEPAQSPASNVAGPSWGGFLSETFGSGDRPPQSTAEG
jgi:hypothetical protein